MQHFNLRAGTKQLLMALQRRFFQAVSLDEPMDVTRVAASLLPVSQLYGFEMSYLYSRDYYEK
ncbi:hypothetical protein EH228_16490 [Erwinia endophytica]|uniref:hypothetical protein n=1 Tax=Erwinia endophytica TaxID=1563158 RepID=UPI001265E894|nr:hypothetical protein [Erwinia endophytica]KAB8307565.1 hypothetical protein EH228_16490 [Erwinia endophytica]